MCWRFASVVLLFAFAQSAIARDMLDFDTMQSGSYRHGVDLSAYAPGPDAKPPSHVFEGRLRLSGTPTTRTLVADKDYLRASDIAQARTLPQDFDYAFVQDKDVLIPIRRGPIPSSHGWWEFVLEPGKVWDEPGDHGYTRAAIPFSLVQKNANCTHNGVLMLLFDDKGAMSRAAMQVSSETCQYLQLDMWGWLQATYVPQSVVGAAGAIAAHTRDVASRLPTKPLAALPEYHPGFVPDNLSIGAARANTRHGVLIDGVHYVSPCPTRHGDYPYCDVLDVPSFSVAKSAVAAIALMRMEQLYPGTAAKAVSSVVPATGCRSDAWRDIDLANLLDMDTGHYDSSAYMADEDSAKIVGFFQPTAHPYKLAFACEAYPRKQAPGEVWVYHTSDTYLLGVALEAELRSQPARSQQEVFSDVLVPDIYRPLGLSQTALVTRRTYDDYAQPFFGWGLTLHADDIVKLARFLGPDKGHVQGRALLDQSMLDTAMQRNPDARGLQVATLDRYRYQHGIWARNVQSELGCEQPTWVPFMSGFGGITVVMFPNGVVWYNVADDGQLPSIDFAAPAQEINRYQAFCSRG